MLQIPPPSELKIYYPLSYGINSALVYSLKSQSTGRPFIRRRPLEARGDWQHRAWEAMPFFHRFYCSTSQQEPLRQGTRLLWFPAENGSETPSTVPKPGAVQRQPCVAGQLARSRSNTVVTIHAPATRLARVTFLYDAVV